MFPVRETCDRGLDPKDGEIAKSVGELLQDEEQEYDIGTEFAAQLVKIVPHDSGTFSCYIGGIVPIEGYFMKWVS